MKPKILGDDGNYDEWCEEEIIKAYKDVAEYDDVLFGDHDSSYVWLDDKTEDVSWGPTWSSFFINNWKGSL